MPPSPQVKSSKKKKDTNNKASEKTLKTVAKANIKLKFAKAKSDSDEAFSDCKKAAIERLKVLGLDVASAGHCRSHDEKKNIRKAWFDTVHEAVFDGRGDVSGIKEFLKYDHVVSNIFWTDWHEGIQTYYTSFLEMHDVSEGSLNHERFGDDALMRVARINGDEIIGEFLLKNMVKNEKSSGTRHFCKDSSILGGVIEQGAHIKLSPDVGDVQLGRFESFRSSSCYDFQQNVLHICAIKRRREFARLVVRYFGRAGLHQRGYNRKSRLRKVRSPVELGIERLLGSDIWKDKKVKKVLKWRRKVREDLWRKWDLENSERSDPTYFQLS